jgi:hypothetical protein
LLARALFKNLSVGREQSTKRDHTIVRNSKGGLGGFPPENFCFAKKKEKALPNIDQYKYSYVVSAGLTFPGPGAILF